jgi:hypothetical protein
MRVTAIYFTESFLHRNNGELGTQCERIFSSIEEALAAPLPDGHTSASIQVEGGHHIYSKTWGWQFQPTGFTFSDSERTHLSEMRAIAIDEQGRQVLVGLSMDETVFYQTYIRRRAAGTRERDRTNQPRFQELHQKHEWHRMQVIALGTKNAPPSLKCIHFARNLFHISASAFMKLSQSSAFQDTLGSSLSSRYCPFGHINVDLSAWIM